MFLKLLIWSAIAIAHGPSLDHDQYRVRAKAQASFSHIPPEGVIGVAVLSARSPECHRAASRWYTHQHAIRNTPPYASIVLEGPWEDAFCIFGANKEDYARFFRHCGIVTPCELFLWETPEDCPWEAEGEAEITLLTVRSRIGRIGGGRSVSEFPWKRNQ